MKKDKNVIDIHWLTVMMKGNKINLPIIVKFDSTMEKMMIFNNLK